MSSNALAAKAIAKAPSSPDWFINATSSSAQHKTGLVVRLEKMPKQKKATLDIEGIQKLAGTEWAMKANVLIEQGIFLLENGAR